MEERRTVWLGERELVYLLTRKPVKNVNLRIRRDGTVAVSASDWITAERVDAFVAEKGTFILQGQERMARQAARRPAPLELVTGEHIWLLGRRLPLTVTQSAKGGVTWNEMGLTLAVRDPDNPGTKRRVLGKFWDALCRETFGEALTRLHPRLADSGAPMPSLHIRNTTSRWGSCSALRASVNLSKRLLQVPPACIDFVVMHELCHLVQPNHSARFYALMDKTMPDWRERKAELSRGTINWL